MFWKRKREAKGRFIKPDDLALGVVQEFDTNLGDTTTGASPTQDSGNLSVDNSAVLEERRVSGKWAKVVKGPLEKEKGKEGKGGGGGGRKGVMFF